MKNTQLKIKQFKKLNTKNKTILEKYVKSKNDIEDKIKKYNGDIELLEKEIEKNTSKVNTIVTTIIPQEKQTTNSKKLF
jgi:hypothetical protein